MPGPTARHARHCPSDEGLASSLRYLSPRAGDITPQEVQSAGDAYHQARVALWDLLLADERGAILLHFQETPPRPGRPAEMHLATLRHVDAAFTRSAALVRTPEERQILAWARAFRHIATLGLLGLAAAFARAHRGAGRGGGRGLNLVAPGEEAIQGALEHVIRGLDAYDPSRGVRVTTFVAWHAFRGVQLERLRSGPVRLNGTALSRWAELQDLEAHLAQELGRHPTAEEVAEVFGSPSKYRTAIAAAQVLRPVVQANRTADDETSPWEIADDDLQPDEVVECLESARRAAAVMNEVAPAGTRERVVAEALAAGGMKAATEAVGKTVAARDRSVMRRRAADLR